jgi:hypothetical protein
MLAHWDMADISGVHMGRMKLIEALGRRLDMSFIVVLLQSGKSGASVVLRAATALLVPEMLTSVWREESCNPVS